MAKELPNDVTIELAVVGAITLYPSKFNDIAKYIISDNVWYDNRCRVLWNILAGMIKRREHIDIKTVSANLDAVDMALGVNNVLLTVRKVQVRKVR